MKKYWTIALMAVAAAGCGKKSSSSSAGTKSYSAEKPSAVMTAVASSISTVGAGMKTSTALAAKSSKGSFHTFLSDADCTTHGDPQSTSQSDGSFAGKMTYCKLSVDDGSPETVQGVFSGVAKIACMVENAKPTYDGQEHTLTFTFDSTCFTAAELTDMGLTAGQTATAQVTASSPAAFNTYYDRGIAISINLGDEMTYKFATKVTGNKLEVAFAETTGTDGKRTGSGAGSLDLDNGIVRVESRMDRLDCETESSCGWNRHVRLYSTLEMDGTTPKSPKDVEFVYSNIQGPPGQDGWGGMLVTASGDLSTTGIKARGFNASNNPASESDLATIANWSEVTNTNCYTKTSDSASTCGTGLDKMSTNTKFVMAGTGYQSPIDWFNGHTGLTFTSVSADSDAP